MGGYGREGLPLQRHPVTNDPWPDATLISDADVHSEVRRLLAEGGDKAVSFGSISKATGLAGPTLVQRFGSREGMLKAALRRRMGPAGWPRQKPQRRMPR